MIVTLIVRAYFAIAILTFAYLFTKFWRDRTTSKTQLSSWTGSHLSITIMADCLAYILLGAKRQQT
ncbi:hypothetical protein AB3M80_10570 [Arthrospira platensis BEA 1257B]